MEKQINIKIYADGRFHQCNTFKDGRGAGDGRGYGNGMGSAHGINSWLDASQGMRIDSISTYTEFNL